jgi:hypothetical protein
MRKIFPIYVERPISIAIWIAIAFFLLTQATAQQPAARIVEPIDNSQRALIGDSLPPVALTSIDLGALSGGTNLSGISIYFRRSGTQEASLQALIAAQQNPSSTLYHHWLTTDEFAARFGMADSDIAQVRSWLEQQGFSVDGVSRSKNRISFSGTASKVESAFGIQLHSYRSGGKTIYAASGYISIPSALSSVVQSVRNLSSLRPNSFVKFRTPQSTIKPSFTSSQSNDHYLTPGDVAVIYDIKAAYSAGYTGEGQSIAIVGQSEIEVSDIEAFQTAVGLTVKDPTLVLVPDSGTAAVSSGDEAESDLDLEYSGAIATGATIYFVYVGNNSNYSVYDSLQYAVDTRIAPVISISYGSCEPELGSSDYSSLESILEQGASQGQTIVSASGDDGSTSCANDTSLSTSEQEQLAVNYPASSEYATGMGGSEFPSADVSSSNTTYWESASGSDVVTSALSYIPEQVWNDDSSSDGLSSGGGGGSTLTARPSWQTGVAGISSGSYRLVPDISLDASPNNAGFLYCSSDSSSTGITGSCSNGFRDTNDEYLTVAGGTSFDAPIFSGMVAIINQKENSTGQGVINSTLYSLASNATTYASAFHDITSGSNECTAGSTYCSSAGESEYLATTGYDEASGLGSIDLYNLLTNWPSSSSASLTASSTTLTVATASPSSGASDTITITVAAGKSVSSIATTPTGTVSVAVDGTTEASSLALSSGAATYAFTSTTGGAHVITATYSGDSTYAESTGTVTVSVGGSTTTTSSGTFALAATNVTVSQGSSASSTITITSESSYAGTVDLTLSTDSTSLEDYGCYDVSNTAVTADGKATATLTLYTSESACDTTSSVKKGTARHNFVKIVRTASGSKRDNPASRTALPISFAAIFTGILLTGLGRRRTSLRAFRICLVLLASALVATGCGSSSNSSTSTADDVAKGNYSLTVDGTDSSNSSITAETTFTLTVD